MSGLYISGMEMPEDEAVGLFLYPDGTVHVWRKTSAVGQEYDAIAVPEHGRMGDLDELLDRAFGCVDEETFLAFQFLVNGSAIIIPASKEGEG